MEHARMELARHWRHRHARYRLQGSRHSINGSVAFPPREGNEWEPFVLSGQGTVITYTVVHQPPLGHHGEVPYTLAIVALAEGPMITAQLSDCQANEVQIGMQVEMVTRLLGNEGEDGLLLYGYKFRPVI